MILQNAKAGVAQRFYKLNVCSLGLKIQCSQFHDDSVPCVIYMVDNAKLGASK